MRLLLALTLVFGLVCYASTAEDADATTHADDGPEAEDAGGEHEHEHEHDAEGGHDHDSDGKQDHDHDKVHKEDHSEHADEDNGEADSNGAAENDGTSDQNDEENGSSAVHAAAFTIMAGLAYHILA